MFSRNQISGALGKVIHPEKKKDIVSLGMVAEIESDDSGIFLIIVPEMSNDPFISSIKSSVVKILKKELGPDAVIKEIRVEPKFIVGKQSEKPKDILPGVKNIIAVSSGKGGVGKTTIAVNLAVSLASKGYNVGLLDADIFGPSVPIMFDAENYKPEVRRKNDNDIIVPLFKYGVKVLSIGFFIDPADAVKGISMFRSNKINVPVLGLVENMSWFTPAELPENKYYIFGKEGCKALAAKMDVPLLGQIPIVQSICEGSDKGYPVALEANTAGLAFMALADKLVEKVNSGNKNQKPTKRL